MKKSGQYQYKCKDVYRLPAKRKVGVSKKINYNRVYLAWFFFFFFFWNFYKFFIFFTLIFCFCFYKLFSFSVFSRILELEKQLKNDNLELPPIFSDLKSQVENFRNKLETAERLKRSELQKGPFCQRFQYRRTSSERGRKIREKFLNIW